MRKIVEAGAYSEDSGRSCKNCKWWDTKDTIKEQKGFNLCKTKSDLWDDDNGILTYTGPNYSCKNWKG